MFLIWVRCGIIAEEDALYPCRVSSEMLHLILYLRFIGADLYVVHAYNRTTYESYLRANQGTIDRKSNANRPETTEQKTAPHLSEFCGLPRISNRLQDLRDDSAVSMSSLKAKAFQNMVIASGRASKWRPPSEIP